MTRASRVRGAILDVDGTLVNSNDAHARAWLEALAAFDIPVEFSAVRRLIGMGGDKLLPAIASIDAESVRGKEISERRSSIFTERFLPRISAFPQTRALVTKLRASGLSVAVASSAQKAELSALLEIANVTDLIEAATSANDAASSKPDPDIVHAALARLDLAPERVLMIGDTPYDIEAARRAQIRTIAFRSGGRSDADLAGALAIYDGPQDLLTRFDSSPFAKQSEAGAA